MKRATERLLKAKKKKVRRHPTTSRTDAEFIAKSRLAAIVESSDDAIIGKTLDGVITSWNAGAERIYGYSAEEVKGRHISILVPPDLIDELNETLERIRRGEVVRNYETRRRRKDGKVIDVSLAVSVVRDSTGKIVGASTIARDITEAKRMGEKLRESEERVSALFNRVLDGIYRSTHEGRFVDVNPALVKMFGYSGTQEMLDIPDIKKELYFSPEERGSHLLDTNQDEVKEYRMRRKDGSEIWVEDHGHYIHDEQGNIVFHEGILRDVTERKRMEDEIKRYSEHLEELVAERTRQLAESEKRFKDFADLLPQPAYETDEKGNFTFLNKAGLAITGATLDQLQKGISLFQPLVPEDRERAKQSFLRVLKTGETPAPQEYTLQRKDGSVVPVMNASAPLTRNGKIVGVIGSSIDITERKRMEEELRATKERMEYVIASNPAVIYSGKPLPDLSDWVLTYVSNRVVPVLGYSPEEFKSGVMFWREHVHPNDLEANPAIVQELWKKGQLTYEYQFRHKDGSYRWIREEAIVTRDADGKPIEVDGYWIDVTEQRRLEEELQAAKQRLEYVVRLNPAVIYTGNPLPNCSDWSLTYVSERVLGMLGFEPREIIGHPKIWEDRIHTDDWPSMLEAASHLKEGHYACDYRFLHKDGRYRWIHEEAILVRDAGGEPFEVVGCWTDITELKDFEQRLAQVEHLAAIGETAAMVGHDLRNPLQGIAGATYLLREESLTRDERNEMLELIEKNVEYSDGIVKDLLDYARPLELTRIETTPKQIAASALHTLQVPGRIKVLDLSQDQPSISVDPDRMKRAFVNLLENAIDAMPNGGSLTVNSKESDGFVELSISDTGGGISKELMLNLWKPLQTTKPKGMGMGLAIVKRIIEAHDGDVSAETKMGLGTVFKIRLPIHPEQVNRA